MPIWPLPAAGRPATNVFSWILQHAIYFALLSAFAMTEPVAAGFLIPKSWLITTCLGLMLGVPSSIWAVSAWVSGRGYEYVQTIKDQKEAIEKSTSEINRVAKDLTEYKRDVKELLLEINKDVKGLGTASQTNEVKMGRIETKMEGVEAKLGYLANTRTAPESTPTNTGGKRQ